MRRSLTRSLAAGATLAAATATSLGVAVAPASAATAYHVTLHPSSGSITYGHTVRVTGRVTGGPVSGRRVSLAWRNNQAVHPAWHSLGRAHLSSHGRFAKRFRPRAGGDFELKAVKSRVGSHARGAATTNVLVYRWHSLWDYDEGAASAYEGTGTIASVSYPHSVVLHDADEAGFVTQGCKSLRGLVGVGWAGTAVTGTMTMEDEGTLVASIGAYAYRGPVHFQAPKDEADSLSVTASVDPGPDNTMVLAQPQVLCWQRPGTA